MSTLAFLLIVLFPAIIYLISVSYFLRQGEKLKTNYNNLSKARDYWQRRYYDLLDNTNRTIDRLQANNEQAAENFSQLQAHNKDLAKAAKETIANAPKFQVVANTQKHPAANDNYLYIEGVINGQREAGLFTFTDWKLAKERLLKNPEDKPL